MSTGTQCLFCKTSFHCRLRNVKAHEIGKKHKERAAGACRQAQKGKIVKRAAALAAADAIPEAPSSSSESDRPE
eukprot:1024930-Pelagomonas_calceolata.AAC.1